jgi:hypothetical protein
MMNNSNRFQQHAASHHAKMRRVKPRDNGNRGIVLVLTLFAVILLAGMVMFVINIGRQTARKTSLQNAADASAIAGSGWVARSLNTVAMNNVNMTRTLAMINVVDAMPDATMFTITEHTSELEAVQSTLGRGVQDSWVRDQLIDVSDEIRVELDTLVPMDAFFQSDDLTKYTFYEGPGGRGQFWTAMEGMDALSQVTMEKVGELAQINAVEGARVNLEREQGESGEFMAPLLPMIPWQRGEFDDFQFPLLNGLLPEDLDDKEFNRGPWDTIFGWRRLIGGQTPGYWVSTGGGKPRTGGGGGKGSVPIGRGAGGGGGGGGSRRFVKTGDREPDKYAVYGWHRWMLDRVGHFASDHIPRSRFMSWENRLTNYKVGYLFPGTAPRFVINPEFITDYDEAVQIAEDDRSRIKETWFVAVEVKSKYPRTHGSFLTPGTYSFFVDNNRDDRNTPRRVIVNGWMDAGTWGVEQIGDWQWRDEFEYELFWDPSIGIPLIKKADGTYETQTAYRVDTFVFIGVNVGEEYEIRNPHNFTDKTNMPAPIDLDHTQLAHDDEEARQNHLNYLAVARLDDRAKAWPTRFRGNKPYPNQVSVAQAHVFNNHSWDLWTQMWEAQLRPVEDVEAWIARIEETAGDAPPEVDQEEVEQLTEYLRAVRDLGEITTDRDR